MKIALVAACDRYNYGDILMPIIVSKELEKNLDNTKIEYDYFGLTDSNMQFCRRS